MTDPIAGKTIALAAGGTGGHVYPALAILHALQKRQPKPEILYFGRTEGLEKRLMAEQEVSYIGLAIRGIPRKPSIRWISGPALILLAFLRTVLIFLRRRPHLVIGFGSYVAGPVVLAAVCLRIPTIVHEQNSIPGAANRVLAPWVTRVLVSTTETGRMLKRPDASVVGIPLRPEVLQRTGKPENLSLEPGKKCLLVFGGSQGAQSLCETVLDCLQRLMPDLPDWQVLLVTGPANYERIRSNPLPDRVLVRDYLDDMGSAYAAADLVLCRAGAVSLAEITANGLPCVTIPLPHATGQHQLKNAQALENQGAAVVIENRELNSNRLYSVLKRLATDDAALKIMAQAARKTGHPEATQQFLREIEDVLKKC